MIAGKDGKVPVEEYVAASGVDSSLLRQVADSLRGSGSAVVICVAAAGKSMDPLLLSGAAQYLTTQLPGNSAFLPLGEAFSKPGKVDFVDILDGIESGKIKVLLNFGEVFPHMYPQIRESLSKLSHLVSTVTLKSDIGGTEGTWLPAALNLEKTGTLDTAFGPRQSQSVVEPYSGAKSVEEIIAGIASEMSVSLDRGKASIPEWSLEEDVLTKRASNLASKAKGGLVLVGESLAYGFRGFFDDGAYVKVNPREAEKLKLRDGDRVHLKTSQAEAILKLTVTDRVPAGVAVAPAQSADTRALFELSIDGKVMSLGPQSVELWKEKA
jgi:anaerobic selenocysteine-containing dehydrogenase